LALGRVFLTWYNCTSYWLQAKSPVSPYDETPAATEAAEIQGEVPVLRDCTVVVAFTSPLVQPRDAELAVIEVTVRLLGGAVGGDATVMFVTAVVLNGQTMLYVIDAVGTAAIDALPFIGPAVTTMDELVVAGMVTTPGGVGASRLHA
jgi:hypothetical protein